MKQQELQVGMLVQSLNFPVGLWVVIGWFHNYTTNEVAVYLVRSVKEKIAPGKRYRFAPIYTVDLSDIRSL